MSPVAARKRPRSQALTGLEQAETERERAEALVALTDEVASADPDLSRYRFSLLAMMRGALSAGRVSDELAGAPRIVVDGIRLPGFDAADIAREATVRGMAKARVFDEELLTASAVSLLLGSRSKNPRQYANKLRVRGEIVGVPHQNQYLYPAFQFDEERGRVYPAAARVNAILHAAEDAWGVASWWVSMDSGIGRVPKELLGESGGDVVLEELARGLAEDD